MTNIDYDRDEWFRQLRIRVGESDKNWGIALLLSIFLGWLGVDRFYLGYPWLGMVKLFTFGGFGVWAVIDIVLILFNRVSDAEGKILRR
jgi:TM2 domain-containing membrane protein YozV